MTAAGPRTRPSDDARDGERPVLETRGLTKRFGELTAVDDVDLRIPAGEFRSLIGPNGAGKTTFFNLVTGAVAPTRGTVQFRGENVTGLSAAERVRRGIGRSFQITTVFGGLTVRENVRLAAQAVHGADMTVRERLFADKDEFPAVNERVRTVLDGIGLESVADVHADALAYGDRRRLEIGLVLATDPELVLLDEPTAGMSAEETETTMALIDEVLADRTLLLIEHDVDLVMDVSDRVTVLHRGAELATGSPAEIASDERVQSAYLGEMET